MKLKLNELVEGKFYNCYYNINIQYYFQFKELKKSVIYCDDYYLSVHNFKGKYFKNKYFRDIGWYNYCLFFEECLFIDFVNYLPIEHPDRLAYYRQKKIEYLLNI